MRLDGQYTFVTLDDLIVNNLDMLFPGMEIATCALFRVSRNAIVEPSQEAANDLLELIETELRERHFAPIVRLEVQAGMDPVHRGMLAAELGLNEEQDVVEVDCMMGMRDLFELAFLDIPELHDAPHRPGDHPMLANDRRNIFHIIREKGPLLLQHPYESFSTTVERFLRTAAEDPKVLAIKMTLYRTSGGGILDSLVEAARNGKQVAVLVELKARFDEAANIGWARRLEAEGIHVTYGVMGLKTHSKLIFIVRRDYSQLRRYYHIGTGNYHGGTAKLYTDFGMLGCDEAIGQDLTELFNYLTGYSPPPSYRKILAAPYTLKSGILDRIAREIRHQEQNGDGHVQMKMNAIEDKDVVRALYKASRAGVKVDLIVRDTCRFRPGIPGLKRKGAGGQHRRALPGARTDHVLPQRWRRGVLHRLGRHDGAQPRKPGGGPRPGGVPGAAPGASADLGRAARRPALRLGHAVRRDLHPAPLPGRHRQGGPGDPHRGRRAARRRGREAQGEEDALAAPEPLPMAGQGESGLTEADPAAKDRRDVQTEVRTRA